MPEKPGLFMARMAAVDTASGAAGAAYALAPVPNFNSAYHVISSTLELSPATGKAEQPSLRFRDAPAEKTAGQDASVPSGANMVERIFRPGDVIHYECDVRGARLGRVEELPRLEIQIRMFDEEYGFDFWAPPEPLRSVSGERQRVAGRIGIPADLPAGHYILALNAIDKLAPNLMDLSFGTVLMDLWVVGPERAETLGGQK